MAEEWIQKQIVWIFWILFFFGFDTWSEKHACQNIWPDKSARVSLLATHRSHIRKHLPFDQQTTGSFCTKQSSCTIHPYPKSQQMPAHAANASRKHLKGQSGHRICNAVPMIDIYQQHAGFVASYHNGSVCKMTGLEIRSLRLPHLWLWCLWVILPFFRSVMTASLAKHLASMKWVETSLLCPGPNIFAYTGLKARIDVWTCRIIFEATKSFHCIVPLMNTTPAITNQTFARCHTLEFWGSNTMPRRHCSPKMQWTAL